MIQVTETPALSPRAVEELSARHEEPDWLLERRLEAWRLFEESPMPDPLSDEWKHTDVGGMTLEGLVSYAAAGSRAENGDGFPAELRSLGESQKELAGRLAQLDSDIVDRSLGDELARQGVILTDLHTAARDRPELVREHMHSAVSPGEWKYLGLQGALWSGGCLVYVPKGVEIELPIEYAVALTAPGTGLFPHLLVVAEPNSKVTVLQDGTSPALEGLNVVSGAVEVIAGEGAQVRLVDLQRWGRNVQDFTTMRALLSKDASLQVFLLGLGGSITKSRLDVRLKGKGARTDLLGLFFGDGDQHFDYDTRQDHIGPATESDLLFKSTLTDRASMAWNGVVDVRETAGQSSANQTSRNLLLSDQASASPTPILEISAHDVVRCGHGATVGPLDEEQVFYLKSRGVPADEAERMLVDGFSAEVLERVPSELLQRRVRAELESKLAG